MSIEQIFNFVEVSPTLATGGQPSEEELGELARAGFEAIINLGLLDPRYCLPDEAGLVQDLGLRYHHLPVDFQGPEASDLEAFIALMTACREMRVFVHCAANKRVSAFVALYGETRLGWTRAEADALIHRVWTPDPVWMRFIDEGRRRPATEKGDASAE